MPAPPDPLAGAMLEHSKTLLSVATSQVASAEQIATSQVASAEQIALRANVSAQQIAQLAHSSAQSIAEHQNNLRSIVEIALLSLMDIYPEEATSFQQLYGHLCNEEKAVLPVLGGWMSIACGYPSFQSTNNFSKIASDLTMRVDFMRRWQLLGPLIKVSGTGTDRVHLGRPANNYTRVQNLDPTTMTSNAWVSRFPTLAPSE